MEPARVVYVDVVGSASLKLTLKKDVPARKVWASLASRRVDAATHVLETPGGAVLGIDDLAIWPFGIPTFYFCLLWSHRHRIDPPLEDASAEHSQAARILAEDSSSNMVDRPNLDAGSSSELHWSHRATSLQHFALRRMASWTFGLAQSADETRSETIGLVKRQAAKLKLRERDESISHLSFLFEEYEPRCYLFVVPDLFRKLCMTSLLVFIYPGSATQIATGLLIALISAKVYSYAAPYIEYSDDAVAELAQTQIVIIFFMCLMIFVTKKMEEQSGQPGDLFQGTVFSSTTPISDASTTPSARTSRRSSP